uniref:KRAB domain-containing protein n=1 Tax=Leptobrachium leishanense TaxID=445787 RepID=A0A8C5Q4Y5_9ANUR
MSLISSLLPPAECEFEDVAVYFSQEEWDCSFIQNIFYWEEPCVRGHREMERGEEPCVRGRYSAQR